MNKTREVRELQLSSTQLIILFMSILILGVFIFLLGVSVGKKQAKLSQETDLARKPSITQVKRTPPVVPQEAEPSPIEKEIASHAKQPASGLPLSQPGGTPKKTAQPAVTPPAETALVKPKTQAVKSPAAKSSVAPQAPANKQTTSGRTTTAAPPIKTAAPVKGLYYIQLAAFEDRQGAEDYALDIKAAGFPTIILSPLATDKTPWYRVRVGGYATKEDAEKAVVRLKSSVSKKNFEYWITRD
ncbi:MAG: SPOR domain-containing protein [Candidatus Aminicenantes bacterium]|nr:SPOR domain-containing protein [Candidatus Aminicenantes bacterium]